MGSSINIVPVTGVELVGAVSEGGQPKSHMTFLSKFIPKQGFCERKNVANVWKGYNINVT